MNKNLHIHAHNRVELTLKIMSRYLRTFYHGMHAMLHTVKLIERNCRNSDVNSVHKSREVFSIYSF